MSTLSTTSPPAGASADLLQRLRTATDEHPTELKWLDGIIAVFLLAFFLRGRHETEIYAL